MRKYQEHQQEARDNTFTLVFWFLFGVATTAGLTSLVVTYLVAVYLEFNGVSPNEHTSALAWSYFAVFACCSAVISIVSYLKISALAGGGHVVAESLGGELLEPSADNLHHRKALNIVEEMAIASGIPTPPVYLLPHDSGINAFAAGYSPQDAVIGLTKGCVERLNRDQLQGVIAHEFSHIFNGDMRLNIRMVGVLHGILFLVTTAEMIISHGQQLMEDERPRHGKGDPFINGLVLIVIGSMLWPVGMIGYLVSYLIKAATCRQREFLADASAVQFTRNPRGIASALKTILGHDKGSRVTSPQAKEVSHFFFACSGGSIERMMLLHPPMRERIVRLEPDWDGVAEYADDASLGEYDGHFASSMNLVSQTAMGLVGSSLSEPASSSDVAELTARDNNVSQRIVTEFHSGQEHMAQVKDSIPDLFIDLVSTADGGEVFLYAVWFHFQRDQDELLASSAFSGAKKLVPALKTLSDPQIIWLMDMALSLACQTQGMERSRLRKNIQLFQQHTADTSLAGWSWCEVMKAMLCESAEVRTLHGSLQNVAESCNKLVSMLCQIDGETPAMAEYAFHRAIVPLKLEDPEFYLCNGFDAGDINSFLDDIRTVAARARREILVACGNCASADRDISIEESLLVRGICARLGYQIPLLLPGQPIKPGM